MRKAEHKAPSAGALRAARVLQRHFGLHRASTGDLAAIIDRETCAGRLAEALRRLDDYCCEYSDCGPGDWENYRKETLHKAARKALAEWEGRSA